MSLIVIVMIGLALVALAAFTAVVLLDKEPGGTAHPRCDGSGGRNACTSCRAAIAREREPHTCDLCEGRTNACAPGGGWPVQRYSMPEHNGFDAYPVDTWLCTPCAYLTAEALSEHAASIAALDREPGPSEAQLERADR